ncbi:MAG: DinB family protein [Actinomycetota bacterium]|nr:DinB family protein [Actinomycetota bacterium]
MLSPDPVAEGIAYRDALLALLGNDDPVAVQSETPERLRTIVKDAGDALRVRPEPKEWSVLELIAHIADAELVCAGRYRWTIAHDEPQLLGYDQDRWVDRLQANDANPDEILALLEALRRANIALWQRTPDEEKQRAGLHSERGPETYEQLFLMMAGHDRFHLNQIDETLAALR